MNCIICKNLQNKMLKPYDSNISSVLVDSKDKERIIFSVVPKKCVTENQLSEEELNDLNMIIKDITSKYDNYKILENDNKFRGEETTHYQIKVVVSIN